MADLPIYPPEYHAAFAHAFKEKAERCEGEEAERAKTLALFELALFFESLAFRLRAKNSARNEVKLS